MISMFMNIGIMNLFPLWSFTRQSLFTLLTTILAICSAFICYSLSERIQDKQFSVVHKNVNENQELEQKRHTVLKRLETHHNLAAEPETKFDLPTDLFAMGSDSLRLNIDEQVKKSFKMQLLCFDLPDMNVYKMGNLQAGISIALIFAGILWYMLQETIATKPDEKHCPGWPGDKCGKYYKSQAQKWYVLSIMIHMNIAGFFGFLGGISQNRTLLIFALAFTTVPFVGIIQNGVRVMGIAEDVSVMCKEGNDCIEYLWGSGICWECSKQKEYHNTNIFLMVFCNWVALAHLWVCLRFSEKLQLWWEAKRNNVDTSIGATCNFLCCKANLTRLYFYALVFSAVVILACGIAHIDYGRQAAMSKQTWEHGTDPVVVLDDPQFIDANFICGFFAIISAGCVFYFVYYQSRYFYFFTFCLLAQTLSGSWNNGIWYFLDLKYGIGDGFDAPLCNSTLVFWEGMSNNTLNPDPYNNTQIYIDGDARQVLWLSIIAHFTCYITCVLAIFFGMLACEALQDLERMLNDNSEAKMRRALDVY